VVRDGIFKAETAEPAIGQIQVNLFAQTALGPDAKAVSKDEHANHQLWIDRWASRVAVIRRKVSAQIAEVKDTVDATQEMIQRHVIIEVE
jgi:hypothetical protein